MWLQLENSNNGLEMLNLKYVTFIEFATRTELAPGCFFIYYHTEQCKIITEKFVTEEERTKRFALVRHYL